MVQNLWPATGAIPLSSNCPWCTLLQRITFNEESDNDYSTRLTSVGFRTKTSFCNCCPPSLNQEKEDDHEANYQETSTSFPESIRVQHQPGNSYFSFVAHICTLVDCNFIFRMQLKKSPIQKVQYNMRWLQLLMYWWRQARGKLTQSMLLMSRQALLGRSLLNRPTLLLQNR